MRQNKYLLLLFLIHNLFAGEIRDKSESEIYNLAGKDIELSFQKISIDPVAKKKIEKEARQRFFKDFVYVWKISENDSITGYAVLDNVYGKSMPITFLVILNNGGKINAARIIKYREAYGGSISNIGWLNQFAGKNAKSGYETGKDIDAISGATISVNALAKGIKKLVLLFPYIQKNITENTDN